MSDNHDGPNGSANAAESADDIRRGTIDFDLDPRLTPGGPPGRSVEAGSSGSLISWAELLRQQQGGSEDEVALGSLPELQINAVSDHDILKSLEREANRSGLMLRPTGDSANRLKGEAKPPSGTR